MKRFIKDCITEEDNETFDVYRIAVVVFTLLVVYLCVFHLDKVVEYIDTLIVSILGGGGVSTALKGRFERPSNRLAYPTQSIAQPQETQYNPPKPATEKINIDDILNQNRAP